MTWTDLIAHLLKIKAPHQKRKKTFDELETLLYVVEYTVLPKVIDSAVDNDSVWKLAVLGSFHSLTCKYIHKNINLCPPSSY